MSKNVNGDDDKNVNDCGYVNDCENEYGHY